MNAFSKKTVKVCFALALVLTFNCSTGEEKKEDDKYAYCVYSDEHHCLTGPFSSCPNGGSPSNSCPYEGTVSGSSSSVVGSSSSDEVITGKSSSSSAVIDDIESVKIGTQTWMKKNLNVDVKGSKCYDDLPANCEKYGRLYDWATAMALPSKCNTTDCASQIQQPKHRGVCPEGWHIPTNDEWDMLYKFVDNSYVVEADFGYSKTAGKHLKAKSGWNEGGNGDDTYGFAALPGGGGDGYSDIDFGGVGDFGCWWSANEYNAYHDYLAYAREMNHNSEGAFWGERSKEFFRFSVRCLQDDTNYIPSSSSSLQQSSSSLTSSSSSSLQYLQSSSSQYSQGSSSSSSTTIANADYIWELADGGQVKTGGYWYPYDDSYENGGNGDGGCSSTDFPESSDTEDIVSGVLQSRGGAIGFQFTSDCTYMYRFAGIGFDWFDYGSEKGRNPLEVATAINIEYSLVADGGVSCVLELASDFVTQYNNFTCGLPPTADSVTNRVCTFSHDFTQMDGWGVENVSLTSAVMASEGLRLKCEAGSYDTGEKTATLTLKSISVQ